MVSASRAGQKLQGSYVYLFTSDRYFAGVMEPVANLVKVVVNLPKTRSIKGSKVPEVMAAAKAMMLSIQLLRSAYWKMRWGRSTKEESWMLVAKLDSPHSYS